MLSFVKCLLSRSDQPKWLFGQNTTVYAMLCFDRTIVSFILQHNGLAAIKKRVQISVWFLKYFRRWLWENILWGVAPCRLVEVAFSSALKVESVSLFEMSLNLSRLLCIVS